MVTSKKQPQYKNYVPAVGFGRNTGEMAALIKRFRTEHPNASKDRITETEQFNRWYEDLESKVKKWTYNVLSGNDTFREEYLNPRLREKILSIEDDKIICDVGCGIGTSVIPYLKESHKYIGIDSSKYNLELCQGLHKKLGLDILSYWSGLYFSEDPKYDAHKKRLAFGALPSAIPVRASSFDEVICSMVLPSVEDYKTSIESLMTILKPEGSYFITTFNSDNIDMIKRSFGSINSRKESKIVGTYRYPNGNIAQNQTVYLHDNQRMFDELNKYSKDVKMQDCGEIFQIFEGIKK